MWNKQLVTFAKQVGSGTQGCFRGNLLKFTPQCLKEFSPIFRLSSGSVEHLTLFHQHWRVLPNLFLCTTPMSTQQDCKSSPRTTVVEIDSHRNYSLIPLIKRFTVAQDWKGPCSQSSRTQENQRQLQNRKTCRQWEGVKIQGWGKSLHVRGTMIRSGNWGQDLLTFCFSWFSILTRRSSKWPSFMRLLSTWSGVTVGPRAVEPASPPDSCIFLNTFSNPYLPQVFLSLNRFPHPSCWWWIRTPLKTPYKKKTLKRRLKTVCSRESVHGYQPKADCKAAENNLEKLLRNPDI